MKNLLTLFFICLLAGCQKSNIKPQSTAESSDCRVFMVTPEGKVCFSETALWLQACVGELARNQSNEVRCFNGIGANDVTFMPQVDPAEEIFQKCINIKPLPADKASNYKKWLKDRVSEIQSIVPGATRREVNRILTQNGGVFIPSAITYSHKECDVLKVRIQFKLVSNEAGHKGFYLNENDKVNSVSMPYLGFFTAD